MLSTNKNTIWHAIPLLLLVLLASPVLITTDSSHQANATKDNKKLELVCTTQEPCLHGLCLGKPCFSTKTSVDNNGNNDDNGLVNNQIITPTKTTTTITYTPSYPSSDGTITVSNPTYTNPVVNYGDSSSNCQTAPIASVTASNSLKNNNNNNNNDTPDKALDNNFNTKWTANGFGSFLQLNLDTIKNICGIDIAWYKGDKQQNIFMISTSKDGNTFSDVLRGTTIGSSKDFVNYKIMPNIDAKYVRLTSYGAKSGDNNGDNKSVQIAELRVDTRNGASSPLSIASPQTSSPLTPPSNLTPNTATIPTRTIQSQQQPVVITTDQQTHGQAPSAQQIIQNQNYQQQQQKLQSPASSEISPAQFVNQLLPALMIGTNNNNHPPVADDKYIQVSSAPSSRFEITLTGSDPDKTDILNFSVVDLPLYGKLEVGTKPYSVLYIPDNVGFTGQDRFTYKITDSHGIDTRNLGVVHISLKP
jgi:hypothetical protein